MSVMSWLMARWAKLPPAETRNVALTRNLAIPMPDGVSLLADHYAPVGLGERPTVLTRSVYTDRTKGGWVTRLLAEYGFHALVVSGRGTCGSGGELDPFAQERDDGLAVLAWLKRQDWFNGVLGTFGASYSGYTQWAIARDAGPMLQAMTTQITSSDFRSVLYPGNALALEIFLGWTSMVHHQEQPLPAFYASLLGGRKRRAAACRHLPLGTADTVVLGDSVGFWREWLEHESPEDPWWARSDHSYTVAKVTAPNHLVSGWRDFMLPSLVRDYQALRRAGRDPYLTIGPWDHWDTGVSTTGFREGIGWLRAHLLGDRAGLREMPVRVYVQGAEEWRDLPARVRPQRWHLQPGGRLASAPPPASGPDRYRYDPADPTPSVVRLPRLMRATTGKPDDQILERRADVLAYTSAPLESDLEVIGIPVAEVHVGGDGEHTDLYVRLCDIQPSGAVRHVSDGLRRLAPGRSAPEPDGLWRVRLDLAPTAYRFGRGHRIRVQLAGGAFPRWNRNLGTGEPLATGTTMRAVSQHVAHDPAHPSAVTLPTTP
jgi:uncharacterized protein